MTDDPAESVHPVVRVGAAWTWRLLVLFAGLVVIGMIVHRLESVVVLVALALLASALLSPLVDWMQRRGIPRVVAVIVSILGSLGLLVGILTFVVEQFIEGVPALTDQFTGSVTQIQDWLTQGPCTSARTRSAVPATRWSGRCSRIRKLSPVAR